MNFYIDNGLISYDEVISAFQKGHIEKDDLKQYFLDTLPNSRSEYVHDKINSVIEDINEGRFPVCYKVKPEMVGYVLGNIPEEELAKNMLLKKFSRHTDVKDIDLSFITTAEFDGRNKNDVVRISSVIADDGYDKSIEFPVDDVHIKLSDVTPTFSYSVPDLCEEDDYIPLSRNVIMDKTAPDDETFIKESSEKFSKIKTKFKNTINTLNESYDFTSQFTETKNGLVMEIRDFVTLPEVTTDIEFATTSKTPFSDFLDILETATNNIEKFPNKADEIILLCDAIKDYRDSFTNEYSFVDVVHKLDINYIAFNTSKEEKINIFENRENAYMDYNELKELYENKLNEDVKYDMNDKDI